MPDIYAERSAAYLHVAQSYKTYTQFEEGFHLTNTLSADETTQWLNAMGILIYQEEAPTPWDTPYSNSKIFPVVIPTDQIIGINPHGWLWTERSLAKRKIELES